MKVRSPPRGQSLSLLSSWAGSDPAHSVPAPPTLLRVHLGYLRWDHPRC